MNKQTKILIGLGAVAVAYYFWKQKSSTKCPDGQVLSPVMCDQAPCPEVCVPSMPRPGCTNSVANCKDGTKIQYEDCEYYRIQDPCRNNGGSI
jgi:hypothetical protein